MAAGPGYRPPGWLTSASTGRAPFVQLIDVAPTVLRALGLDRPGVDERPADAGAGGSGPRWPTRVAELDRANTARGRALPQHRRRSSGCWCVRQRRVVAARRCWSWAAGGRAGRAPLARLGRAGARRPGAAALALAVAALPVATYLADLVPWERAGAPRWPRWSAPVAAADLVVTAVAAARARGGAARLGPGRSSCWRVTLVTLAGDVLTGSHLELDGLLGYDAIVAGRFTGYGNLTFGLLSVSALLLTAAAATAAGPPAAAPPRRRLAAAGARSLGVVVRRADRRARSWAATSAACWPRVPGFLLLAMLLARIRVTVGPAGRGARRRRRRRRHVAVLDWLRPADRAQPPRPVRRAGARPARRGRWSAARGRRTSASCCGSPLAWMLPVALAGRRAGWSGPGGLLRSRPAPGRGRAVAPSDVRRAAGRRCSPSR